MFWRITKFSFLKLVQKNVSKLWKLTFSVCDYFHNSCTYLAFHGDFLFAILLFTPFAPGGHWEYWASVEHDDKLDQRGENETEGRQQEVVHCLHITDFRHVPVHVPLQQNWCQNGGDAKSNSGWDSRRWYKEAAPRQDNQHYGRNKDRRYKALCASSKRKHRCETCEGTFCKKRKKNYQRN